MAEFFDEKGILRKFQVYPCPNCQEIVNNKMTQCKACGSSLLDPESFEREYEAGKWKKSKPEIFLLILGVIGLVIFLWFSGARQLVGFAYWIENNQTFICREFPCLRQGRPKVSTTNAEINFYYCDHHDPGNIITYSKGGWGEGPGLSSFLYGVFFGLAMPIAALILLFSDLRGRRKQKAKA